jgi:hypothetical protein
MLITTMVIPNTIMDTSTNTMIQGMNAEALSRMEQGMNQDAVEVLRQATRHLIAWLNHQQYYLEEVMARYQEVMAIASSDCAQPWYRYVPHFPIGSLKYEREASGFGIISLVASSPFSSILSQGNCSISSTNMIHHHAVPLPKLRCDNEIYNCAFRLPFSDEAIQSIEYRTQAIAIIMYNMALASHRYGIQSGKSEPLAHATVAYNKVLGIVGPSALQLFPEIAVLFLGTMCNLAHIHLELRHMPEFLSCLAILRNLMTNIRQHQMSKQDFGFFNMQLFCFDREAIWLPPAA